MRRHAATDSELPILSTFTGVIEPYENRSGILGAQRLKLLTEQGDEYPDIHVALSIQLASGERDVIVAMDMENPLALVPTWAAGSSYRIGISNIRCDGELCWFRFSASGELIRYATWNAHTLYIPENGQITLPETSYVEWP